MGEFRFSEIILTPPRGLWYNGKKTSTRPLHGRVNGDIDPYKFSSAPVGADCISARGSCASRKIFAERTSAEGL